MAHEASATVQMDKNGRVTIPKPARKALGIEDTSADLDLDIQLVNPMHRPNSNWVDCPQCDNRTPTNGTYCGHCGTEL